MKALAAEMVRNFGGRLEPLGISVKELTGDMKLSKSEIIKTQVSSFIYILIIDDNFSSNFFHVGHLFLELLRFIIDKSKFYYLRGI